SRQSGQGRISSTSWKNQAPASVAAATAAIASAATAAGSEAKRVGGEWAAADVTDILRSTIHAQTGTSVLSRRRGRVETRTITSARVDPEAPPAIFRPLRRTGHLPRDRRPLWRNW